MLFTRSPLKQRVNDYKQYKSPFSDKKQQNSSTPLNKDKKMKINNYLDKNINDRYTTSEFMIGPNCIHTKSEMIYEPEINYEEKYDHKYQKNTFLDNKLMKGKNINDQRKFNAKQFEMESKINKIKNYQNKIESLLDFVKSTTPKKTFEKLNTPTKSVSKLATPLRLNRYEYCKQNLKNTYHPTFEHKQQMNNGLIDYQRHDNTKKNTQFQELERKNKYFRHEAKTIEQNRKKSRQFMKNVEGEVKQIKQTVEELNQKIKKVGFPFKKQVILNLESSNPDSLKDFVELHQEKGLNYEYSQNRDKNLSKFQKYKMRKRQRSERKQSPSLQIYKQSGYIYDFKV